MPQKHDIGWKKRQSNTKPSIPTPGPESYARELVLRGLASPNVLDRSIKPQGENE
jgi:hypothetical protein